MSPAAQAAQPQHPDHDPTAGDPGRLGADLGRPTDPIRLRRRTWWTTVGVVYGVGAWLLMAIVLTERSVPVAVVAASGSVVAAVASARLLERRLPGTAATTGADDMWRSGGLGMAAVAGAIAALAAAQWSGTVMGALVPGVATAAIAVQAPARWRGPAVSAGAVTTVVVVAAARRVAVGRVDWATVANQVLLMLAVAGGLLVARWFWQLAHRLERARHHQADLAVADERLRFAADLHDVQGHHLHVIARQSELATRLAARDPDAAATQMGAVHDHARTALAETQRLVQGYRKTPLDAELANATRVLDAAGIDGRLDHGTAAAAREVGEPARQLLGLVVREATTNILRHSDAGQARLALHVDSADAHLAIRNDGATSPEHPSGSGLSGLARRLAEVGGDLDWHRADGWFVVTARVPTTAGQPA